MLWLRDSRISFGTNLNPNLDAVFILTRHNSHAGYVKSALDQGKRVFVEKPLAINREQLEMVRTAYARCLATIG